MNTIYVPKRTLDELRDACDARGIDAREIRARASGIPVLHLLANDELYARSARRLVPRPSKPVFYDLEVEEPDVYQALHGT